MKAIPIAIAIAVFGITDAFPKCMYTRRSIYADLYIQGYASRCSLKAKAFYSMTNCREQSPNYVCIVSNVPCVHTKDKGRVMGNNVPFSIGPLSGDKYAYEVKKGC